MFKQDQEIFNILLEVVSEGVVITDDHQNIVEVNKAAEKIFRYDRNDLINSPLNILIPVKHQGKHDTHFKE